MSSPEDNPSPTKETPAAEESAVQSLSEADGLCHMLPCNIDYQGMASTHVYFRPVESEGMCYSTFRGRGLLALNETVEKEDSEYLSAALLSMENKKLQVKAEIDQILEWQHEHNPRSLLLSRDSGRVQVASEWVQLAQALHDPIPVEEELTSPST